MTKTTPELIKKMIALRNDGYSGPQIAERVGLHKNTVRLQLAIAGFPLPNHKTKYTKIGKSGAAFVKANLNKMTVDEMATHLSVHPTYLRTYMHDAGLLTQRMMTRTIWNKEKDELLKKHYATMKMMELEQLLRCSKRSIYERAKILGINCVRYGIDKNPPATRAPRKVVTPVKKEPETPKRVEKTYITMANPTAGKVPVKLNHKTVVYLPSNYTPEMLQAAKSRLNIF
jgi:hypothetical protein